MTDENGDVETGVKAELYENHVPSQQTEILLKSPEEPSKAYIGLTKEEVLQYSSDPAWKKARLIVFVLFWVAWFAMLAAAIIIIIQSEKCPVEPKLNWWEKSGIYQVYTRSFKASGGKGYGNLGGVESKISYVKENVKATAIWLRGLQRVKGSSDFQVVDNNKVQNEIGTEEDFKSLVAALHSKKIKMKIIVDLFASFADSTNNLFKTKPEEYFLSKDFVGKVSPKKDMRLPSTLDGKECDAFFGVTDISAYGANKASACIPLLDLTKPEVQNEILNTVDFWMKLGVDGFNLVGAEYMYIPFVAQGKGSEFFTFISSIREKITQKRLLMTQVILNDSTTANKTHWLYGTEENPGVGLINFVVDAPDAMSYGKTVMEIVETYRERAKNDIVPVYRLSFASGSPYTKRSAGSFGRDYTMALNFLTQILSGAPVTYMGEEFGIGGYDGITQIPGKVCTECLSSRLLMPWSSQNDTYGGFLDPQLDEDESGGKPKKKKSWLEEEGLSNPLPKDWKVVNVQHETAQGSPMSLLKVFSKIASLHLIETEKGLPEERKSLIFGNIRKYAITKNIFAFLLDADKLPRHIIAVNLGKTAEVVDLSKAASEGSVVFASKYGSSDFKIDSMIPLDNLRLESGQALVIEIEREPPKE